MIIRICTLVFGFSAVLLLSGCYTARTYVVNKPRVDQDIPGQAAGTPVKTRKVVVFEVIEKDKQHPALAAEEPRGGAAVTSSPSVKEDEFALPQSGPAVERTLTEKASPVVAAAPQAYVVEKDDTLQKISKKVYGVYSQWTKIYDANRDVIKDPNFLKAGMTLKIPVLETPVSGENQ